MAKEFIPGSADEYPVAPIIEVTLPSGFPARIRKPNFYILGRTGQVPKKVEAAKERTRKVAEEPATVAVPSGTEITARMEDVELMVNWALTKAFVEPPVSLVPVDGAILASDICADDKTFVLDTLEIEV